ncbi:hypothetical protein LCGC14_2790340, partial [marine sediment metagenome]
IIYSQKNVKITPFYSENLENSGSKRKPVLLSQDRVKFVERGKGNLLTPQQNKFVSNELL